MASSLGFGSPSTTFPDKIRKTPFSDSVSLCLRAKKHLDEVMPETRWSDLQYVPRHPLLTLDYKIFFKKILKWGGKGLATVPQLSFPGLGHGPNLYLAVSTFNC